MEDPLELFPRIPSTEPGSFFQGVYTPGNLPGRPRDAFITRFDTSGAINWSTLIASDGYDMIRDIAIRNNILLLAGEHNWSGGAVVGKPGSYQQGYSGIADGWFDDGTVKSFQLLPPEPRKHTVKSCVFPIQLDAGEAGIKSYQWSSGSTSAAINVQTAGIYVVRKQTFGGCTIVDSFDVIAESAPQTPLLAEETVSFCEGDSIELNVLQTPGASYLWRHGSTEPGVMVHQPGLYHVSASLGNCVVADSVYVELALPPSVFLGVDTLICTGERILLQVKDVDGSYAWQDGSDKSSYEVTAKGLYWVEVTSSVGCKASDSILIDETNCQLPSLPSAFSPNGDGLNDLLRFVGLGGEFKLVHLSVYNRWGELVFYSNNLHQGWDGRFKGVLCEIGTYYCHWELSATRTGKRFQGKSDVTLVR